MPSIKPILRVTIDPELAGEIEKTCAAHHNTHTVEWTPEQDAILLKYWKSPLISQEKLVAFFKKKYGFGGACTLRNRWIRLTAKEAALFGQPNPRTRNTPGKET